MKSKKILSNFLSMLLVLSFFSFNSNKTNAAQNSYGFTSPFKGIYALNYVSSEFGLRWGKMHNGIDFSGGPVNTGTPIYAVKSGTATFTYNNGNGYGNYITIDHGNGIFTRYAHCNTLNGSGTRKVTQGELIGTVGSTGDSTGPHLHFEVILGTTKVNPRPYLEGAGDPDPVQSLKIGRTVSGDFNGDGYDDYAALYNYGNNKVQMHVFKNNKNGGFLTSESWFISYNYDVNRVGGRMVAGDFDGDGDDDIAVMYDDGGNNLTIQKFVSTKSSFNMVSSYTTSQYNPNNVSGRAVAGDFDGDGKDDIAAMYDYNNGSMAIHTFKSNGSGFNYERWNSETGYTFAPSRVTGRIVSGDFNGDGKDDIGTMYDHGNTSPDMLVFKSTGTSFEKFKNYRTANEYVPKNITGRMVAGDFNGDGKDDIAAMYDYNNGNMTIHTFKANGEGFDNYSAWNSETGYNFAPSRVTGRMATGDFNKDGKDDIVGMYDHGSSRIDIHLFKGNSTNFSKYVSMLSQSAYNPDNLMNILN